MAVAGEEQAGSIFEDMLNEIRAAETERDTRDKPEDIASQTTPPAATPIQDKAVQQVEAGQASTGTTSATTGTPPAGGQIDNSPANAAEASAGLPATAQAALQAQALGTVRYGQNPSFNTPDDETRGASTVDGSPPLDTSTLPSARVTAAGMQMSGARADLAAAAANASSPGSGNDASAGTPDGETPAAAAISVLAPEDEAGSGGKQPPLGPDSSNIRQASPGATSDALRTPDANLASGQQSLAQGFAVELKSIVAQPAHTAPAMPIPLDALAVTIARKAEQGLNQFEISLSPAELGKLDISLRISDDGRVHAVLRAERAETLDLLRQDSRTLENQLRQAGLDVGSSSLSFQLSQGNPNRYRTANPEGGSPGQSSDGQNRNPDSVTHIAIRRKSGIDIHV
jgi:flagellar hook-length control protein FliK